MSNKVSDHHLKTKCQPMTFNTCRYLVCGLKGFECVKLTRLKAVIDKRADAGHMRAVADNCPGIGDCQPESEKEFVN